MGRKLALLVAIFVGLGAWVLVSGYCLADDKAPPTTDKSATPAKTDKPADSPKASPEDESKKTDKYLGIDWGDDSKKKAPAKDNPDAAQPAKKVDLTTALTEAQQKRLDVIKKQVAEGDKLADLAQSTHDGTNKSAKKEMAPKQFAAAAVIFQKGMLDIQSFVKSIPDQDTKLTLLRDLYDTYKKRACEMFCRAGKATLEMAGDSIENVKTAVDYYKKAYAIDPDSSEVKDGVEACRTTYKDITTRLAAKTGGSGGTGSSDSKNNKTYDPNNIIKQQEGVPMDPAHTGHHY